MLDVGAGQGVLAPYVNERGARYTGVDASQRLIDAARRRHGAIGRFLVGDARRLSSVTGLRPAAYDAGVFLLSIQDMDPLDAIFESVDWALTRTSRVVIVMTHPAFRQPRHAGWGFDDGRKLLYRRIDSYLTPMAVPMKALGGRPPTRSFHRPVSAYVNGLAAVGFCVDRMIEPTDLPDAERPRPRSDARVESGGDARARARAEAEIPLFLALRAVR